MASPLHFISGLPRSGSTLLSALLRQNPRFSAAMTSPVASMVSALHPAMCGGEFNSFFDDAKRAEILRGVFESYYPELSENHVVFDTNRSWTARIPLLIDLYPQSRIICCVREIGWIIDSVERMLAKNPLQLSRVFNFQPGATVYSRVELMMNSDNGLIGLPWGALREAWFGDNAKRLIIVPYDHLVKQPKQTLARIYTELGEPAFTHDFDNVVYDEPDYDSHLGMPGLHAVKKKVEFHERKPSIPPDIFAKYAATQFWGNPELNARGVLIL